MATGLLTSTVLFVTCRKKAVKPVNGQPSFGDRVAADGAAGLTGATATVGGIDISNPAHGRIVSMGPLTAGGLSPADLAPVLQSGKDILVFVHGAANTFEDAILRAGYNKQWLAAAKMPSQSTDFDVIAFTWPARDYEYLNPLAVNDDYKHDQAQASASAAHFCLFLAQMKALRQKIGNRKMNLLCHSMGNYMLGGAIESWSKTAPANAPSLFDQVILAAADEIATTFATPKGGRLANLSKLTRRITTYYNYDDVLMRLSLVANGSFRLGYDGPPNRADTKAFPRATFDFVDCYGVNDYISSIFDEPDRSHQYYRQSPTVRVDIAQVLMGLSPHRLSYSGKDNSFSLFPQPVSS